MINITTLYALLLLSIFSYNAIKSYFHNLFDFIINLIFLLLVCIVYFFSGNSFIPVFILCNTLFFTNLYYKNIKINHYNYNIRTDRTTNYIFFKTKILDVEIIRANKCTTKYVAICFGIVGKWIELIRLSFVMKDNNCVLINN